MPLKVNDGVKSDKTTGDGPSTATASIAGDNDAACSVVALTTLGTRRHKAQFLYGFDALIERVQPAAVLCYGQPFPEMARVRLHVYPSRYDQFMGVRDGR